MLCLLSDKIAWKRESGLQLLARDTAIHEALHAVRWLHAIEAKSSDPSMTPPPSGKNARSRLIERFTDAPGAGEAGVDLEIRLFGGVLGWQSGLSLAVDCSPWHSTTTAALPLAAAAAHT